MNDRTIYDRIGVAEYSYYFVLKSFVPMLERFGEVILVDNNEEANKHYLESKCDGVRCILFCFSPPHNLLVDIECLVVPVFAWEFDTIPNVSLEQGNSTLDWVSVLDKCRLAITHSKYSKKAVKRALSGDRPIFAIPSPVWDNQSVPRKKILFSKPTKSFTLEFKGECLDSHFIDTDQLDQQHGEQRKKGIEPNELFAGKPNLSGDVAQKSVPGRGVKVVLSGAVYTSIFNPYDYRKNWEAMITAFFYAFRHRRDATLLIKISANHYAAFTDRVVDMLRRLEPYQCRIVVIYGFLETYQYQKLMVGSTYYVNTSFSEGQCLPLMEFLSAGVPAIAPRSSALSEYVYPWNAFVLRSHPEPTHWQHDPREKFRATHYRVEWQALVNAYKTSYMVTKIWALPIYKVLQLGAVITLKFHCSINSCAGKFKKVLNEIVVSRS
ncbi:MAG: glycosyltransferase family 1 protein [Ketobacter sp.]|nr:MAG: glycosyltransferase family 1 protein [Ketobacter sp.]